MSTYYAVVTEWDDGTVATTVVADSSGVPIANPTRDQIRTATWLVAASVEMSDDVSGPDKERIHLVSERNDVVHYSVGDGEEDDGWDGNDTVYSQQMGIAKVS